MSFIRLSGTRVRKFVLGLFIVYFMVGSLIYLFQERLIFLPEPLAKNYKYDLLHPYEELYFNPSEDAEINALLIKAKISKGLIFYHHGNAGNLQRWSKEIDVFITLGYDVLIYDYRTYGKSVGKLSEAVLYSDAQFLYEFAKTQYKESEITLYGRSLGTGIASYLGVDNRPKQLILETPYYSLLDVAQSRFPILPVRQLMAYKIPSYQFLTQVKCPILMIHGTADRIIPYKSALKLKNSLSDNKNAHFISVPKGKHNNLGLFNEYHKGVKSFLN